MGSAATPKKPKPNKTLLQFAKKKRKRSDSGSDVDMEDSATFAPKVDDSERRRSGRQTQRKKYVDDVDLNLSEDENLLMDNLPPDVQAAAAKAADKNEDGNGKSEPASKEASKPNSGTTTPKEPPTPASTDGKADDNDVSQSGPNYAYVDPTAEDTMVVQLILASRMGTRELESDEEDENAFEVSREHLTKFIGKAPPTKSQLQEAIEKAAIDAKNPKAEQSNDKPKDEPVKTEETDNNEKKAEIEEPKVEKKTENEEPKETEKNDNDKETKAENPEKSEENIVEASEDLNDKKVEETVDKSTTPEKPKETETPKGTPVNPGIKKKELSKTARMIEVEEY